MNGTIYAIILNRHSIC